MNIYWLFSIVISTYCLGMLLKLSKSKLIGYLSVFFLATSLTCESWGVAAAISRDVITQEVEGKVVEKKLPDGNFVDVVIYKDESGEHEVNINHEFGIKLPHNKLHGKLKLTKIYYAPHALGIMFDSQSKFILDFN